MEEIVLSKKERAFIFILLPVATILFFSTLFASWPYSGNNPFEGLLAAILISLAVGAVSYAIQVPFLARILLTGQMVFLPFYTFAIQSADIGTSSYLFLGPFVAVGAGLAASAIWWALCKWQGFRDKSGLIKRGLVKMSLVLFVAGIILAALYAADASSCGTNLGMRGVIGRDDFLCLSEKAVENDDWRMCLAEPEDGRGSIREVCLDRVSEKIHDPLICEEISEPLYFIDGFPSNANMYLKDSCFENVAVQLKDASLCQRMRDGWLKERCFNQVNQ